MCTVCIRLIGPMHVVVLSIGLIADLRPISVTPVFLRITERLVMRKHLLPVIPNENLRDQFA